MAGCNEKEKDNGQYISHELVCELMEQQKAFYKKLLQQQESNYKVVCIPSWKQQTVEWMPF